MRLITPMISHTGHKSYDVWEYDETRPRMLDAVDRRAHYAVSALVGSFRDLATAERAAETKE